ncbi:MAG: DUF1848 domain-containing protein [Desulfobacterales bacterium]|jgi:hypothetical protein
MNSDPKIVISASRRTDIPAFYMPWFMERIESGFFEIVNPFNRNVKKVSATPDDVHTIVFWSKDFSQFLKYSYGQKLQGAGYRLFFNFTVNTPNELLEPQVPPLDDRLDQLEQLGDQFGPQAINWRFDPICFFELGDGKTQNNLSHLKCIAAKAADIGIKRCITSFMDPYRKIQKRLAHLPGFSFTDPPLKKKRQIILKMEKTVAAHQIKLMLCCEKDILDELPKNTSVTQSACIDNDLLKTLFGGNLSLHRDSGQRIQKGCGCKVSVDIGVYHQHPCYHNCLFCYANPTLK